MYLMRNLGMRVRKAWYTMGSFSKIHKIQSNNVLARRVAVPSLLPVLHRVKMHADLSDFLLG